MEQRIVVDSELVGGRGERSRRWRTVEEKRRIVEETLVPGASVAQVARLHGVNSNQVFHWRRQYQAGDLALASAVAPKLLPVVVSDASEEVSNEVSSQPRAGSIHVEFPGRAFVSIEAGVEPALATAVIERLIR
jgi:transposase